MGFLFTYLVLFVVLVLLVRRFRNKPATTEASEQAVSTQPRTRKVTYVTNSEGWLVAIEEKPVDEVVSEYASRGGKDK